MDDEAEGLDELEDPDIVRRVRKLVGDESESGPRFEMSRMLHCLVLHCLVEVRLFPMQTDAEHTG